MKKALSRLGYYLPYEKVGITDMADTGVFDALKAFQKDYALPVTGSAKPHDETIRALNEAPKTQKGQYIWRTVEDEKVREDHAKFNRIVRDLSDDPDPGEEFNCRCWMEILPLNNCKEEKEQYAEAQKNVKKLSEKFNDLLLQINKLIEDDARLLQKAQKSLIAQMVPYILTLPFDKLGILHELLSRYFASIISRESLKAAENFMKQSHAIKQQIKMTQNQISLTYKQLKDAAKELQYAKEKLENCKQNAKKHE